MKIRHILLVIGLILIFFNTLAGGILDAYEMSSCLLVNLSIFLSAGLIYYLFASTVSDGFKIGLAVIFCFTGIFRMICVGIMGTETQNNIAMLLAVFILLIEVALMFIVSYLSKK